VSDVKLTQRRSANAIKPNQRETLRSLGLGRIGRSVVRPDSPQLQGMIRTVSHLIQVEEAGS
jgi:large subunit ribosomal protein L30